MYDTVRYGVHDFSGLFPISYTRFFIVIYIPGDVQERKTVNFLTGLHVSVANGFMYSVQMMKICREKVLMRLTK